MALDFSRNLILVKFSENKVIEGEGGGGHDEKIQA